MLPLNNYEYRNSYKDNYDNQGVRVNPELIKNFSSINTTSSSSSTHNASSNSANNASASNISKQQSTLLTAKTMTTSPLKEHELPLKSSKSPGLVAKTSLSSPSKTHSHHESAGELIQIDETNNHQSLAINENGKAEEVNAQLTLVQDTVEHIELEDIRFVPNEFLIHRSTFSGDFDNFDIWCVSENKNYLQKYEPVLLSTGERCHQSTDVVRSICNLKIGGNNLKVKFSTRLNN